MKWWDWFWRAIGCLGVAALSLAALAAWAYVRRVPVRPLAQGEPITDGFDVISIQLDILTLAVTVFGIFLGVAAIVGYQSIKTGAESAAREVASDTVTEHIEKLEEWRRGFAPTATPAPELGPVVEVPSEGQTTNGGTAPSTADNPGAPAQGTRAGRRNRSRPRD